MNKKFLSAILFGALMVTSTGTFVSCKDYDDDIDAINSELTTIKSTIAALQSKVDAGNYVTGVTKTAEGITFTFSNGTPVLVEVKDGAQGEAGKDGSIVEVKEGVLYIDGEATDIKVCEEAAAAEFKAAVTIVDGEWAVLQEDGSYLSTGILATSTTAVQNADKSWTLTIKDAEGNAQEVKVPSAATMLSDLMLFEGPQALEITKYRFSYNKNGYSAAPNRDKWAGPKTLPAAGHIYAGTSNLMVQINPTSIDAAELDLTLVDSKNKVPANLTLTPAAYTGLLTRAANPNGLYTLGMSDVYFADAADGSQKASNDFWGQFFNEGKEKRYAVTAGTTVRSEYEVTVEESDNKALTYVRVNRGNTVYKTYEVGTGTYGSESAPSLKVALNTWYQVSPVVAAALYDMHFVVDADDKTLFGFEVEEREGYYAFRITRTPDSITKAGMKVKVQTVDKSGKYNETSFYVGQTSVISGSVTYDAIEHLISKNNSDESKDKNFFQISLDKMKESLGTDGLALWNNKVEGYSVTYYNAAMDAVIAEGSDINEFFVSELKGNLKDNKGKNAAIDSKAAKNMIFAIDNDVAATHFEINKQYNAYIVFTDANGEKLNDILVPFTFKLPAITDLFVIDPGFIKEDVVNLYMYADDFDGKSTFKLSRVFSKYEATGYEIALDATDVVVSDKKSANLATVGGSNKTAVVADKLAMLSLTGTLGEEAGYDQVLKLHISGKYDNAWSYGNEVFTFQAKVMSPIEKGNVSPREGSVVTIKASDLDGYQFGNSLIIGHTYNTEVTYSVLPNKVVTSGNAWTRNDIKTVNAETGNKLYFEVENSGNAYPAKKGTDAEGNEIVVDGYFLLKGYQVDHTVETTIKVKVTDIWNRSKASNVPVKITVGE